MIETVGHNTIRNVWREMRGVVRTYCPIKAERKDLSTAKGKYTVAVLTAQSSWIDRLSWHRYSSYIPLCPVRIEGNVLFAIVLNAIINSNFCKKSSGLVQNAQIYDMLCLCTAWKLLCHLKEVIVWMKLQR